MYCHKCGKEVKENDKYCLDCGTTLTTSKTKKKFFRWLSYGWTIIINLVTIGVVLAIYDNLYDDFEIIAVSLLILIYLSLQTYIITFGKATASTVFALDGEFKRLRKLLNDESDEYEEEEIRKAKKKLDVAEIKMYINGVFLFIIYLIALFNLFGAL